MTNLIFDYEDEILTDKARAHLTQARYSLFDIEFFEELYKMKTWLLGDRLNEPQRYILVKNVDTLKMQTKEIGVTAIGHKFMSSLDSGDYIFKFKCDEDLNLYRLSDLGPKNIISYIDFSEMYKKLLNAGFIQA